MPFFKTSDEFDFSLQSTLRQSLLGSYLGPDFVTEGRSLILYGKTTGRGKTHLAVAIGYRAIQNGFETFCTTAAELIEDLSNAGKHGHLQESKRAAMACSKARPKITPTRVPLSCQPSR